jgi:iron(III) transport system permease protein
LAPLGYLIWGTFLDENGFTLDHFREVFGQEGLAATTITTLKFAGGATFLAVAIGTPLAYLITRTDVPFKPLMFVSALVPLVIPGVLHTVAWMFLLIPRTGLVNHLVEPLFGHPVFDIFSLKGMIFVQGLDLSPLVFLLMTAAFRSMDPSLEEAALMSGARLPTILRRVTLPVVRPALLAALLIMGLQSVEAFEVPALIGVPAGQWTFTSRIWRSLATFPREFGPAGAYSVVLLVATSIGVIMYSRLSRSKAFQTVSGKGFRPRTIELGAWRWPATGFILLYFFVAALLPLFMLAYGSFVPYFDTPSLNELSRLSLDNYRAVLAEDQTFRAFRNSAFLGVASASGVMMLMAVASWIVVRTKLRGRWAIDNVASIPLVVPGIVLGTSLLFLYLRHPLPIYGTLWILFIAYLTKYMPYGMRFASVSMYQISAELEESAQMSGASWWQGFRRVVMPLLLPGFLAGWIYIFTLALRELSASILIYSPGNEVLAVRLWELWQDGRGTQLAALGMMMVATLIVLVTLAYQLSNRVGVRAGRPVSRAVLDAKPLVREL